MAGSNSSSSLLQYDISSGSGNQNESGRGTSSQSMKKRKFSVDTDSDETFTKKLKEEHQRQEGEDEFFTYKNILSILSNILFDTDVISIIIQYTAFVWNPDVWNPQGQVLFRYSNYLLPSVFVWGLDSHTEPEVKHMRALPGEKIYLIINDAETNQDWLTIYNTKTMQKVNEFLISSDEIRFQAPSTFIALLDTGLVEYSIEGEGKENARRYSFPHQLQLLINQSSGVKYHHLFQVCNEYIALHYINTLIVYNYKTLEILYYDSQYSHLSSCCLSKNLFVSVDRKVAKYGNLRTEKKITLEPFAKGNWDQCWFMDDTLCVLSTDYEINLWDSKKNIFLWKTSREPFMGFFHLSAQYFGLEKNGEIQVCAKSNGNKVQMVRYPKEIWVRGHFIDSSKNHDGSPNGIVCLSFNGKLVYITCN